MTPEQKDRIITILINNRDDSLERAEHFWSKLTDVELDEQHGESGRTRREWLDGWREARKEHNELIQALEGLKL